MSSKLEINVRSLISHCEELAKEDANSWRLKKYIRSLETMIDELQTTTDLRPKLSTMDDFYSRCASLKKSINYVPDSPPRSRKLKAKPRYDATASGNGEAVIREINQIYNASYNNEQRHELLGSPDEATTASLRKRAAIGANGSSQVTSTTSDGGQEMGQALKYYGDVQERIAEDMLALTRSLREQTETANRIIRRDTEVVSTSSTLSDRNMSSLAREAEKLSDHSKRAWKCWMWIMIGLVMMIFIFMVMFMKIMKKKA